MSNHSPLQLDPLDGIFKRLNGTLAKVSKLRQFLGDIETDLGAIRQQFENELHGRAVAAADAAAADSSKAYDGNRNATTYNRDLPLPPGPVSSDPIRMDREQETNRDQERENVDRFKVETPRSELTGDPNRVVGNTASLPMTSKSDAHWISSSPMPGSFLDVFGDSELPTRDAIQGENSSGLMSVMRSWFRSGTYIQGSGASGPLQKHAVPLQHPSRQPLRPPHFPEYTDLSSCPPELKCEGDDWFVLFNPSPRVKRVLDVTLEHTLVHKSSVCSVKFNADGTWLATGCYGTAQIYDVKTGVEICVLDHKISEYIRSVCFSPDGKYLATGAENKQVRIWNIANQQIHNIFTGHEGVAFSLHFSSDEFVVSGAGDGTVRIWNVHDGTFRVLTIAGHYLQAEHEVWSVAISPDGRYVAAGGLDVAVNIWEIATGILVQRLGGHGKSVDCVAFTPDGKGLFSGGGDKMLKYWDVSGLGIGSDAGTALIWNTSASFPCLMNLIGYRAYVNSTAVSHDGAWAISGSDDGTVMFWDARTGVIQYLLSGHTKNIVWQVDLSPMENLMATVSEDGKARIWSYRPLV